MIAYEELCEALARWRSRNGLQNGPSARPPQGAVVVPPVMSTGAATSEGTAAQGGGPGFGAPGFAPATTEETLVAESQTTVAPNPLVHHEDGEGPTGLHTAVSENTNDLDLDNVVLVDDDADEDDV
jgi:hypothetical protein